SSSSSVWTDAPPAAGGPVPAVDVDRRRGDEPGRAARKKEGDRGGGPGRAHEPEGRDAGGLVLASAAQHLGTDVAIAAGGDRVRGDGVHADAPRRELEGERARQLGESGLHRAVDGEAGRGLVRL